jgi:hypothetical protein
MVKKNVLAYVYKQRFCKGDSSECARFVVMKRLGKESVPVDLYPNEMAKAREIMLSKLINEETMTTICECFDKCELFSNSVANLPSTSKSFKDKFCSLDHNACARFMVYKRLGQDSVPTDLFPNERGRAMELIDAA